MDDIQRCLVVCRECSERDGRPYRVACGSPAAQRVSLKAHWDCGHDARPVAGWPSPQEAWRLAFGREQR